VKASFKVALAMAGVCLAGRAQAQTQTVVVGPQAGSMALLPGAQVTVPIVADLTGSGGASLGSATLRLLWHPGVLAYRGVTGGALGQPVVNADSAGGSLRVAVANPAGVIGHPVLFSATFAVVGAPGSSDTLQLQLQELTSAVTFANLLPGVATAAHVCVSTGLWGDLNVDGAVNGADALTILTHAVGLPIAPYTTVNGDVDGDGQINTRDALIVLTYAVELPVNGFRVGAMNPGACSVQQAASVQIQPRNAEVAVGDQFPLVATVRDSGGAAVQGVNLVWTSADTTVVKADGTGHLVGMKPGTARVFAFAAPGLNDGVTVTVDSTRHVWWVNPALAALNGGVELGSTTRPFSSIGQALARAAANDSVMIAPATYGEVVHFARPLTLVGDSTAAGATVIRNPAGAGITVDSLPGGGLVRLDHLRIDDSQGGVVAQSGPTGVLSLSRLRVERSTGLGISVTGAARLLIDHSLVQGAVGQALTATGVAFVGVHAVFTDAVTSSGMGSNVRPIGVRVTGADSLIVDSLAVGTAGVWVDSARVMRVDGFQSLGTDGAGLAARIGDTFSLTNADVADASWANSQQDSVPAVAVVLTPGTGTAQIVNTVIRHSGRSALVVLGGDSVLVSGVDIQNTQVTQNAMAGPGDAAFFEGMRRVAVQFSSFLDNNGADVFFADPSATMQATVDSSAFRATVLRAAGGALLDVRRSLFQNTAGSAIVTEGVRLVSLLRVDEGGLTAKPDNSAGYGGPFGVDVTAADSLYLGALYAHDNPFGAVICRSCRAVRADTSTFLRNGSYTGYLPEQGGTVVLEYPRSVGVYGVRIDGGGSAGLWLRGEGHGSRLAVDSSAFVGDSTSLVYVDQPNWHGDEDTVLVTRSSFRGRGQGGYGVQVAGFTGGVTVSGSAFESITTGVGVYSAGPATVYGNTFTGVEEGLGASNTSDVVFDSNAVTCSNPGASDAVHLYAVGGWVTRNVLAGCLRGLWSQNQSNARGLVVFGNTISRDSTYSSNLVDITGPYDSVVVSSNIIQGGRGTALSLLGQITTARVDSNTVQGVFGNGIVVAGFFMNPVEMTYNVIADNDTNGLVVTVPVNGTYNTVLRNKGNGVMFEPGSSHSTFRAANLMGNQRYAIVGDSMGPPTDSADGSWWGDPMGPRCVLPFCFPGSHGDRMGPGLILPPDPMLNFPSFFSTTWITLAPPDPGPPAAAPVFRAARAHVTLPRHIEARPMARPTTAPAARPAPRPRPAAPVTPRRVMP
jgi:hypothetical protein